MNRRGFLLSAGTVVAATAFPSMIYKAMANTASASLPSIYGENFTFNHEGHTEAGWTSTNCTLASSDSYLRMTKSVSPGSVARMDCAASFPCGTDYIVYGRVRGSRATPKDTTVVWIENGAKQIAIWLGSPDAGSTFLHGTASLRVADGSSETRVQLDSGIEYDSTPVEFALQYCGKFSQLNVWFREADGRWKFKGRAPCQWFSSAAISVLKGSASATSTWSEIDYLSICRPNLVAIGDSICAGSIGFNPNSARSLGNDDSTWLRHAKVYPHLRNNLIVNKGVGGESSAQISARISDATKTGAQVIFLHASSNDTFVKMSQADRTGNIQKSIHAINVTGAKAVLLNASYGTPSGSGNTPAPVLRDYMTEWWGEQRVGLIGVAAAIDVMAPVKDENGFLSIDMAADGIHPNIAGYQAVGQCVAMS